MKRGPIKLSLFLLAAICAGSALLLLPTINNNINDPNMITYFNVDEGYQMDLIWYYYSGEKRDSYHMDVDYGLEMLYLSDLTRLIFSKFIEFGPGTFVLLLRWLHLLSWIAALVALWYLVGCHFKKGWQQILTVLLLAVRPAYNYFSNSLKPEPLVLLFMIIGLYFILRIVEKPSYKHLLISTLCASIAFHIKFAGVFLLPAIIAAMYFGHSYQTGSNKDYIAVFPEIKYSWILELLSGACLIGLPFLFIFFYVRKSTNVTFYQEFGLGGSLLNNKVVFLVFFIGIIFILMPLIFFSIRKSNNPALRKIVRKISQINSYIFIVTRLFFILSLLSGFRWIFNPRHFIATYSYNLFDFSGLFEIKTNSSAISFTNYLQNIIAKFESFDMLIILLLGIYLFIELYSRGNNLKSNRLQSYKRLTLLIFLAPCFLFMFTLAFGRFSQHHMLPFFVVAGILVVQGADMACLYLKQSKMNKGYIILTILWAIFTLDIALNATALIKSRVYQFHQNKDIIYDVAKWLRKNVPINTAIIADNYSNVYIPSEYTNIKFFRGKQKEKSDRLRYLVNKYRPQLIYCNVVPCGEISLPPIDIMLPDHTVRLVKSFDSANRSYQRKPGEKFVIYEVLY